MAQFPALPRAVLFLCGQNCIRSPMAEAIARTVLPAGVFLASAGVRPGERDSFVDAVLAEEELALVPRFQPQVMEDLDDTYFDLIVTLAPEAHHAALELTRSSAIDVEYWPTADPSAAGGTREQILNAYRDVRNRLRARIVERFATPGGRETVEKP